LPLPRGSGLKDKGGKKSPPHLPVSIYQAVFLKFPAKNIRNIFPRENITKSGIVLGI